MSHDRATWEYTSLGGFTSVSIDKLNELGRDGWELVAIDRGQAILKRRTNDLREIVTADQRASVYGARSLGDNA